MTELDALRLQKDEFFRSHSQSPLAEEQRGAFGGLRYFPEDPALRLVVTVEALSAQDEIVMPTSTGDERLYRRYGRFRFTVDGQEAALTIYEGPHGFFLPFVDSLAGSETYGAGRYLEPQQLDDDQFLIDFNLAYNPYCAYNEQWSCPIPPRENRISVPIRAGEKLFIDGH